MLKENFLHFVWENSLFDTEYLIYKGQPVQVINPGVYNYDGGPDFFNTRVKIGDTTWVGNAEIHVRASDWYRHNHQDDPAYDNIILHIVYDPDISVYRKSGEEIPFIRLAFHPGLLKKYDSLREQKRNPECYRFFAAAGGVFYQDWIAKLSLVRLERRYREVMADQPKLGQDWDTVLYHRLAAALGANHNRETFMLLSRAVPLKFILKNRHSSLTLNAAFFGQAGLLDELLPDDHYYNQLQREYNSLRKILPEPIPGKHLWKRFRSRPASFPEVRICQLIAIVSKKFPMMERIKQLDDLDKLRGILGEGIDKYWINHFLYGKPGRRPEFRPGNSTLKLWILNGLLPVIFAFGKSSGNTGLCNLVMEYLEDMPPENNEIIKNWNKFGIKAVNAFESQALIELKTRYCVHGRCTKCMVGLKILTNAGK